MGQRDVRGRLHFVSGPFVDGLTMVFTASMLMAVIAAGASLMRGANDVHAEARGARHAGAVPVLEERTPA